MPIEEPTWQSQSGLGIIPIEAVGKKIREHENLLLYPV